MKNYWLKPALLGLFLLFVAACGENAESEQKIPGRWYSQSQADKGQIVYEKTCIECHGTQAQGITADWKKTLPDGSYPPPPLNGTAHAWHHPMKLLKRTINTGGIPIGGKMPAFKDVLIDEDKDNVIAYFQSLWSNKIYNAWLQRGGLK